MLISRARLLLSNMVVYSAVSKSRMLKTTVPLVPSSLPTLAMMETSQLPTDMRLIQVRLLPWKLWGTDTDWISDGPARNPSSVQKGSTLFLSTRTGDPTTPGYPSKKDSPRADISEVIAKIPALPISYSAAQPLLQALNGPWCYR